MNNMIYTFEQLYFYGDNWQGEINVPESVKFYKDYTLSNDQQNWYVFIPTKDYGNINDILQNGCIQVDDYQLLDYTILYLKNVKPLEDWPDIGEGAMNKMFSELFADTYIYRYATAQYNVSINKDAKDLNDIVHSELIQPETLLACYKIKELSSDAEITCTRVNLKHRIELKDDPFIDSITLRLCDIPPQDSYDSKEKLILNHDETLYDLSFNEVTSKLY
jgi:hypothetical protein